jgi:oxygen-independent coproporphyrinogen-3 oxidase
VASFGHINGLHLQNLDTWEAYGAAVESGQLPFGRGYRPSAEERLIREFILQLKRGVLAPPYFREKYDVDVLERFQPQLASLEDSGYLSDRTPDRIALTGDGLVKVDVLLRRFFLPEHADLQYT